LQRYKAAVTCFDQALALDPDYVFALANKGHALNELRKFGEAIACFDTILKTSPNNLRVMTAKGIALRGQGNNTGALAYFDAVLALNPLNSFVRENRAIALRNLGRTDEAEESEMLNCQDVFPFFQTGNLAPWYCQRKGKDSTLDKIGGGRHRSPEMVFP
jgi:tetratricopeptide (TPR) repeat protein